VDAIADLIHITWTKGSAADNASFDRAAASPARTGWLLARSIASNVLCSVLGAIPEAGWRRIQRATAVSRSVGDRLSWCIGDTILIQIAILVGVLYFAGGGITYGQGAVAIGLLTLGDCAGLVHVDASCYPH
jgi:hypothetical protein